MELTFFYAITFIALIASVIFIVFWMGNQSIEISKENWGGIPGGLILAIIEIPKIKVRKREQKLFSNLSTTQKIIILISLTLAASISVTMLLFVLFGNDQVIFMIIGTITSIFQTFMIPVAFVIDKL